MSTKKQNHVQPLIEALSRVDFSTVAPRPQILQGCTETDLKNFVKSFEQYELLLSCPRALVPNGCVFMCSRRFHEVLICSPCSPWLK